MKKYMIILFVISSIAFLMSLNKSYSCPTGYTSITKVITVGDCDYSIDICVKCPTGPVPGTITFTGFRLTNPNCNNSLTIDQVFNGIKAAIMNWVFIQDLCAQLQAPPCNQAVVITFYWYNCWNKEKVNYFDGDYIVYQTCDYDSYCEVKKKYCWNGNDFTAETISITQFGAPNCPCNYPPDPTEYNQPTECFRINTVCD